MDVEGLSELSREHGDFFANSSRRGSLQGLHESVLCLLLTYCFLTGYFGSDLQAVLRECEAKYLGKKGVLKEVKRVLKGGDVDRELTRIHQKTQKVYSKWMVRVAT
jgi:hypothetical protein